MIRHVLPKWSGVWDLNLSPFRADMRSPFADAFFTADIDQLLTAVQRFVERFVVCLLHLEYRNHWQYTTTKSEVLIKLDWLNTNDRSSYPHHLTLAVFIYKKGNWSTQEETVGLTRRSKYHEFRMKYILKFLELFRWPYGLSDRNSHWKLMVVKPIRLISSSAFQWARFTENNSRLIISRYPLKTEKSSP